MKYPVSLKWFCVPLLLVLMLPLLPPSTTSLPKASPTVVWRLVPSTGAHGFRWVRIGSADGDIGGGAPLPQPANPEYLIIAPNSSWVQDFADWKTKKGVPTLVVNVTWIKNSITSGRDLAENIWIYIHNIYTSTSPPTLRWVLLVGSNSTIPPRYVYLPDTTEWTGLSSISKPTDFYYSVMDDSNWDDDNDGRWGECFTFNVSGPAYDEIGDWFPDLYVGRIPFDSEITIRQILQTAMNYERNPTVFGATGWNTFLLAGSISNYDEEYWDWLDGDYTDEAELCDYIADNHIPGTYQTYHFYEQRSYFWNYTPTNVFSPLSRYAVPNNLTSLSPALVNLAGHGSPDAMWRKYDNDTFPYGIQFNIQQPQANRITGVAIGDIDRDGYNEICVTTNAAGAGAISIRVYDGLDFKTVVNLPSLPTAGVGDWPTCIDTGDLWNNGTMALAVGTWQGYVYVYYPLVYPNIWTIIQINPLEYSPVLCLEVGNADNVLNETTNVPGANMDIAWGHQSGAVFVATGNGAAGVFSFWPVWLLGGAVYSIDVGDPDDDLNGEITAGIGYMGAVGRDGDCYTFHYLPGWQRAIIKQNLGDYVYALDVGDAENDGSNEIALGLGDGAIYTFEGNVAPGGGPDATMQTVQAAGVGYAIFSLRVAGVDQNSHGPNSIIVGTGEPSIIKYHTNSSLSFIDKYPLATPIMLPDNVTALDTGELSYFYGEMTSSNILIDTEIAAGTRNGTVDWYEWNWYLWRRMIDNLDVMSGVTQRPALVYADACLTAAFDWGTSLGSAFLARNWSIGYIGSPRISWYYLGPMSVSLAWGLNRYMTQAFWQLFFSGSTGYRPGWTLYQSKIDYFNTFNGTLSQTSWETAHRKNLLSYLLLGDPEIDIYTADPEALDVTHPLASPQYENITVVVRDSGGSPVAGATVCVRDPASSYYQVALTDSSGQATFNLTSSAGTVLDITVTKHNYQAYEGTVTVAQWITVTGLTLNYDTANLLLNITGVVANCPVHGYLTGTTATRHTWTIMQGDTNITHGQLTWDSGTNTWQAVNLACNDLAEGSYRVRCYFEDADGIGWADSAHFTVEHHITITTPIITYHASSGLLDITGVIATCSYTAHGTLDDTEATVHTYTIYSSTGSPTSITGDLVWNGSQWIYLGVDVSGLSDGTYYVQCTFADSDVPDTNSPASATFTITTTTTTTGTTTTSTPFPPIPGFPAAAIGVALAAALGLSLLRRRRLSPNEEHQRKEEQSPPT